MAPVEALEPPSGSRRARRVVVSGIAVLLAVGGTVGIVAHSGGSQSNAEKELAAVQAFVRAAHSAHVDGTTENVEGNSGGVGQTNTSRSRLDGDLVLPDTGHWVVDDGTNVVETLVVSGGSYVRGAATRSALSTTRWNWAAGLPGSLPLSGPTAAFLTSSAGLTPGSFGPGSSDLRHFIDQLQSPTVVSPGVIRAKSSLNDVFGGAPPPPGVPMPSDVSVDLTVGAGGRLDRLVWRMRVDVPSPPLPSGTVGGDQASFVPSQTTTTADERFSAWNAPVSLDRPPAGQIDPTPGINEEALGAFHAAVLMAPRQIPAGWVLQSADVIPVSMPAGLPAGISFPQPCPSAQLTYGTPTPSLPPPPPPPDPTAASGQPTFVPFPSTTVTLIESAASCQDTGPGIGMTIPPVPVGIPGAGDFHTVTVTVGKTRIQASGNLPEAELRRLVSDAKPLDLASQPIERSVPPAG